MGRLTVVGAVIVMLAQFGSSASAATTRFVDDDHKQCPQATFTKIQAAIDASAGHDLVRVCAGRYPEQLTLPASKPALYVDSFPAGVATVAAPAAGLSSVTVPETGEPQLRLVTLLGSVQHVVGFNVSGPLRPRLAADVCATPVAIDLEGDDTVVDSNTITGLADNACTVFGYGTFGVLASALRGVVERNTIQGAATGVGVQNAVTPTDPGGLVERNVITGRGSASASFGIFAGDPDTATFGNGSIRSNEISAAGTGIRLQYAVGLVRGNTVHDNGTGIHVDDAAAVDVNANIVRHNAGDGVLGAPIPPHSYGTGGTVRGNDVRDNGHDGIAIYGCALHCFPASSTFALDHNVSLGNAHLDCYDAWSPNDTWTANIGITDSPATLCATH
jgi:hypothetical protein